MGEQTVNADDWRNDHKLIKEKIEHVFETSLFHDCEFIVGTKPNQEILKGHKLILVISSPVFEAMFYGDLAEKGQVSIPEMEPKIFRKILKYIYRNTIKLQSFEEAVDIYYGSKKYLLVHLVEECVNYMKTILTPSTVCKIYEFAKYVEEKKLKEQCEKVLMTNTGVVLKGVEFEGVSIDTVVDVMKWENIAITSELELFRALQRWIEHNENKSESKMKGLTVRDALEHIRFLTMSPSEFTEGPANSDLLTEAEKIAIFKNICSRNFNKYPIPNGLSQNHNPRKKIQKGTYGRHVQDEDEDEYEW